jgi:hypothetical protein
MLQLQIVKDLWDTSTLKWGTFPWTAPAYPAAGILFYLLTLVLFMPPSGPHKRSKLSIVSTLVILIHNIILAAFSISTFIVAGQLLLNFYRNGYDVCDGLEEFYAGPFGWWTWAFYLSKFYEFVDTWIVMFKGRRPIVLQVYHHIGAVIGMWLNLAGRSTMGFFFVGVNSGIHSLMYPYYALSTVKIRVPLKFVITLSQMLQFIIGLTFGIYELKTHYKCSRPEDKFIILYHEADVGILFMLFANFYYHTYLKKKTKTK